MSSIIPFNKHFNAKIQLFQDTIYLYGPIDDCAGSLLKGKLVIENDSLVNLHNIHIKLKGVMKSKWNQQQIKINHKFHIIENDLVIDNIVLPKGQHAFDFEFFLNGNLVNSLNLNYGKVEYKINVNIQYPIFNYINHQCNIDKAFKVIRVPLPTCNIMLNQLYLNDNYDYTYYDISSPYIAYGPSDTIPINFQFNNVDNLKSVTCLIKRTIIYKSNNYDELTKTKGYILDNQQINTTHHNRFSMQLKLSNRKYSYFNDIDNPLFQIYHQLKIQLTFNDGKDVLLKHALIALPLNRNEVLNGLPNYPKSYLYLPPSYKSTWCPMDSTPSLNSLPKYEFITFLNSNPNNLVSEV